MIPAATLAGLPFFDDVPDDAIAALSSRAVDVRFTPGSVIFLAGSKPRGWFVVIEGLVRVVRGESGRQHVIHTEGPGGTLGEVPLFTNQTHPATGIAVEATRCALFDRQSLESAMRESPAIGFLLARRLAFRVQHLVERLNDRSALSVRRRLVDFMLERKRVAGKGELTIGMTQRELAEELGTVREVLVRELRGLTREGVIESAGRGRYAVRDLARLRAQTE